MAGGKSKANEELARYVALVREGYTKAEAARLLGVPGTTLINRLKQEILKGHKFDDVFEPAKADAPLFSYPVLPSEISPVEEIIERRKLGYARKHAAEVARKFIQVKVKTTGPVGILHFGDPHVDDDGTDMELLEHHVNLVAKTEGLFGASVGDYSNNWVGRLAGLYGQQHTTAAEAWRLVEWFVGAVPWLYLVGGNHDVWSGAGDPIKWFMRQAPGVYEWHGVRIGLQFPNGREVRINCRHDWRGSSQWNPAHGPAKAAMMGWRDHVLTCGDKHISGYNIVQDPNSGLISHAIRVGSYKRHDEYAKARGFPEGNFGPACVTLIDPDAKQEIGLVTVLWDVDRAVDYLAFLRRKSKN